MEYKPFDSLEKAREYIENNKDICTSDSETKCGLYLVELHSTYDVPTLIEEL